MEIQGFCSFRARFEDNATVVVERIDTTTGDVKRRSKKGFDVEFLDSLQSEIDARYNAGNAIAYNANAAEDFLDRLGFFDDECEHGIDARGFVKIGDKFDKPNYEKDPNAIDIIERAASRFAKEVSELDEDEIAELGEDTNLYLNIGFDDDDMLMIESIRVSLRGDVFKDLEYGIDFDAAELVDMSRDELIDFAKDNIGIAIDGEVWARLQEEIEVYLHAV